MSAVRGTLLVPEGTAPFAALVRITLRDVTHSDDPAPVASIEVDVEFDGAAAPGFVLDGVPAEVLVEADSGRRVLNLEAHADLDRDGVLSPGDLATLGAHPVTGASAEGSIDLDLIRI